MNVGHPSNLCRLFDLYGGSIDKDGNVYRQPYLDKIKQHIKAVWVSDEETISEIKSTYHENKTVLEQHGAVGLAGLKKYLSIVDGNGRKNVVLETAHPAKFPEVIEKELGFSPAIPDSLRQFALAQENSLKIKADYQQFKNILLN